MNRPAWIALIVIAALVFGSAYLVFFVINP
jgi:hypothetical protein